MNYKHAFHAGNFADVVKHILLQRLLFHACVKAKPLRYIDTHAGNGCYSLHCDEALRTGEWVDGIGQLQKASLCEQALPLIAPYLSLLARCRAHYGETTYFGSPLLAQLMLRADGDKLHDKSILIEKHPQVAADLRNIARAWSHTKVLQRDGWETLSALIPPPERRGVVLIDPPYEVANEWDVICTQLLKAWQKWSTGIYALWYPIKDLDALETHMKQIKTSGMRKVLRLEVMIKQPSHEKGLIGTGMLVINPPWLLESEAQILLPELARVLGKDQQLSMTPRSSRIEWLVEE